MKRVWYDVCNDFTLDQRNDSPLDIMEMNYSKYVEEVDGVIFGLDEYEGCVYLFAPQGLNGTCLDDCDLDE